MDFQQVVQQIAWEEHRPPEEIYREMQRAIEDLYRHRNDTPASRAVWRRMGARHCPTPEAFVAWMAGEIRREIHPPQPKP